MNLNYLSILAGISAFFVILALLGNDESVDANTKKRLDGIKNKKFDSDDKANKSKKLNILMSEKGYKFESLGKFLEKFEPANEIKKLLKMADMEISLDMFFLLSGGLVFPFLCLAILQPADAVSFLLVGLIAGVLPYVSVKNKIKKRLHMFTQQLPEALGLISNSLRAGHSLNASFQLVATELPYPVSQVFKILVDDISLGRDSRDALDNMEQNMPGSLDLKFFITAVTIQREIGGNLAEILDSLNFTIRERFKLLGQLRVQTAQARMSGGILAVAPVFIGVIIYVLNPSYLQPLFTTLNGKLALAASITMALIGFITIQKITDIRV